MDFNELAADLRRVSGISPEGAPTLQMVSRLAAEPVGRTVFLDLNHWIGLAKVRKKLSALPDYVRCYEILKSATYDQEVTIVLTSATYMELLFAVSNPVQRADIADVMSELTRFVTIRRRADLIGAQFEQALHERFGRPMFPSKVDVFGIGCSFAFEGVEKRMQLYVSDGVAAGPEDGDLLLYSHLAGEAAEYVVLRGPTDEDKAALAEHGYDVGPVLAVEQERLDRETQLAEDLRNDPAWFDRLHDVVWARELYWELGIRLPELMGRAGMKAEAFFATTRHGSQSSWGRCPASLSSSRYVDNCSLNEADPGRSTISGTSTLSHWLCPTATWSSRTRRRPQL